MRRFHLILLATAAALAASSMSPGGAGQEPLHLLYRDYRNSLGFPLEWYGVADWIRLPGEPVAAPGGGYRLPMEKVADDVHLIQPGQFWAALSSLTPAPANTQVGLPAEARLLLHWEPSAGVVSVENAAFLSSGTGPDLSRIAKSEVPWPPEEAAAKPRNQVPPKELRQCVVAYDPLKTIFDQSQTPVRPGFISLTPSSLQFGAAGDPRTGLGTGAAWLMVAEDRSGEVWLWFADT